MYWFRISLNKRIFVPCSIHVSAIFKLFCKHSRTRLPSRRLSYSFVNNNKINKQRIKEKKKIIIKIKKRKGKKKGKKKKTWSDLPFMGTGQKRWEHNWTAEHWSGFYMNGQKWVWVVSFWSNQN